MQNFRAVSPKAATHLTRRATANAAERTRGREAQKAAAVKLRTVFALRNLTGPKPPSIVVNDAAPQLHETGHSCIAQHLLKNEGRQSGQKSTADRTIMYGGIGSNDTTAVWRSPVRLLRAASEPRQV